MGLTMKKFMLTLIVILPIAVVFFVAFSAATIIREIQYYNITGVSINWGKIGTNGTAPKITLTRGQEFDFVKEDIITVYPARAKVEDIKFEIVEGNYPSYAQKAQEILQIEGSKITAKTNLSNQFSSGISIRMLNKDNSPIKYQLSNNQGQVPNITIDIKATANPPLDFARLDIDYLLSRYQGLINETAPEIYKKEIEEENSTQQYVDTDDNTAPKQTMEYLVVDLDRYNYTNNENNNSIRLNLWNGIVVSPSSYRRADNLEFTISDIEVADMQREGNNIFLDIKKRGEVTIDFLLTVPGLATNNIETGSIHIIVDSWV